MRYDGNGLVRNVAGAVIKAMERQVVEHFADTPLYLEAAIACKIMPANIFIQHLGIDPDISPVDDDRVRLVAARRTTVIEIPPPWREAGPA